jgi:hypothetical protein
MVEAVGGDWYRREETVAAPCHERMSNSSHPQGSPQLVKTRYWVDRP